MVKMVKDGQDGKDGQRLSRWSKIFKMVKDCQHSRNVSLRFYISSVITHVDKIEVTNNSLQLLQTIGEPDDCFARKARYLPSK